MAFDPDAFLQEDDLTTSTLNNSAYQNTATSSFDPDAFLKEDEEEVGTLQGIANSAQNAFDSSRQALLAVGGVDKDQAEQISKLEYAKQARKVSPDYAEYQKAEGWDAVGAFLKNPVEVTTNIIGEGLAGSLPALGAGVAAGAAGAAVGSVVPGIGTGIGYTAGQVAGTFGGSLSTEYGSKILEELQNSGMDITDPNSIQSYFSDEEKLAPIREKALARGVPVAAFDAVSAGIGGKLGRVFGSEIVKEGEKVIGKKFATKTGEALTELGAQAVLGGGGSVAGSVAAGEEVDLKDVFAEVIGEVGPGAAEVIQGRIADRANQRKLTEAKANQNILNLSETLEQNNAPLTAQVTTQELAKQLADDLNVDREKEAVELADLGGQTLKQINEVKAETQTATTKEEVAANLSEEDLNTREQDAKKLVQQYKDAYFESQDPNDRAKAVEFQGVLDAIQVEKRKRSYEKGRSTPTQPQDVTTPTEEVVTPTTGTEVIPLRDAIIQSGIPEEAADIYIDNLKGEGLNEDQIREIADNNKSLREEAARKNEEESIAKRDLAQRARMGDKEARAQLEGERGILATPTAEDITAVPPVSEAATLPVEQAPLTQQAVAQSIEKSVAQPIEKQPYATQEIIQPEVVRQEPQDGTQVRPTTETIVSDSILSPATSQEEGQVIPTSTAEQEKLLGEAKSRYDSEIATYKNQRRLNLINDQELGKKLKAAGMQFSAEKRKVTGQLTDKEFEAEANRKASNYIGKPVEVDGKLGKVIGNPFGRVRVKLDDGGTIITTTSDKVTDRLVAKSTQAEAPIVSEEGAQVSEITPAPTIAEEADIEAGAPPLGTDNLYFENNLAQRAWRLTAGFKYDKEKGDWFHPDYPNTPRAIAEQEITEANPPNADSVRNTLQQLKVKYGVVEPQATATSEPQAVETAQPEPTTFAKGDLVRIPNRVPVYKNGQLVGGRTEMVGASVVQTMPDGKVEVRLQQGGYATLAPNEIESVRKAQPAPAPVTEQAAPAEAPAPEVGDIVAVDRKNNTEFALVKGLLPERPDMFSIGIRLIGSNQPFESGGYGHNTNKDSVMKRFFEKERRNLKDIEIKNQYFQNILNEEEGRVSAVEAKESEKKQQEQEKQRKFNEEKVAYEDAISQVKIPTGKSETMRFTAPDGSDQAFESKRYGDVGIRKVTSGKNALYNVDHWHSGLRIMQFNSLSEAKKFTQAIIASGADISKKDIQESELEKLRPVARYFRSGEVVPSIPSQPTPAPAVSETITPAAPTGPQVGQRVRSGSTPQPFVITEVTPQTARDIELGEQYYKIKNERTGEVSVVESVDITPVKTTRSSKKLKAVYPSKSRVESATQTQDARFAELEARAKAEDKEAQAEAQRMVDEAARAGGYDSENLLFHGTTHIFNVFKKDRANIENDLGKGYYFTNTENDAQVNYAGEGPDLTNRIERLAEQLESNEEIPREEAISKAKEILSGGEQKIINAYLKLDNPFVIGSPNETFLDYNENYDPETEEYGEPSGKLLEFIENFREVASKYDGATPEEGIQKLMEAAMGYDGLGASEIIKILKEDGSGIMYAEDSNGDLASSEIIREAIEATGFDGIVDTLVNRKFGLQRRIGKAMAGMEHGTVHTIAFNSNQIKSANPFTYDDAGNLIPLSQRFNQKTPDIRYARARDKAKYRQKYKSTEVLTKINNYIKNGLVEMKEARDNGNVELIEEISKKIDFASKYNINESELYSEKELEDGVRNFFKGNIPSNVIFTNDIGDDSYASYVLNTGEIEINRAYFKRNVNIDAIIGHELGHFAFGDPEFRKIFINFWDGLTQEQRDAISKYVEENYSAFSPDLKNEEKVIQAWQSLLEENPEIRSKWQKFVELVKKFLNKYFSTKFDVNDSDKFVLNVLNSIRQEFINGRKIVREDGSDFKLQAKAQVHGQEKAGRELESFVGGHKIVEDIVRQNYFDSTKFNDENTQKAYDLLQSLTDFTNGNNNDFAIKLNEDIQSKLKDQDVHPDIKQVIGVQVLRNELQKYSNKLLISGDSFFEKIYKLNANDIPLGIKDVTSSNIARALGAIAKINNPMIGAIQAQGKGEVVQLASTTFGTKEPSTEQINVIEEALKESGKAETINNADILDSVVSAESKTGVNICKDIDATIKKSGVKQKTVDDVINSTETGKTEFAGVDASTAKESIKKQATSPIDAQAERAIEGLAKLQSDVQSWPNKTQNQVRSIVQQDLRQRPDMGRKEAWKSLLTSKLMNAGVSESNAMTLSDLVWKQHEINNMNREIKLIESATENGSLGVIVEMIKNTPLQQQSTPEWRKEVIRQYLMSAGLSEKQAESAARLYDNIIAEKIAEAKQKAFEQSISKTSPWRDHMSRNGQLAKDALKKVLNAVRTSALDPTQNTESIIAKQNGWTGFSESDFRRIAEIDEILNDPKTDDLKKSEVMKELNDIISKTKLPVTVKQALAAYYTGQALMGVPTVTVNIFSPLGFSLRNLFTDIARFGLTDPTRIPLAFDTFLESMRSWYNQTKYAFKNEVYPNDVVEYLNGNNVLKELYNKGKKEWKKGNYATGLRDMLIGSTQITGRVLSALDQGAISALENQAVSRYAIEAMSLTNIPRSQRNVAAQKILEAKRNTYASLIASGMEKDRAGVLSDMEMKKEVLDQLSSLGINPEKIQEVIDSSINDALLSVGRNRTISMDGLSNEQKRLSDSGMLSYLPIKFLEQMASNAAQQGPLMQIFSKMLYGFALVPARTFHNAAWYSPYGFLRIFRDKYQKSKGMESSYGLSLGNELQYRQRLTESIAGSVAMIGLAALAASSTDDDDDRKLKIVVTGNGPDAAADKQYYDSWIKKWKPNSIHIVIGDTVIPINIGRGGEAVFFPIMLAGALDDWNIRNKMNKAKKKPADLNQATVMLGSAFLALAQRGPYAAFGKPLFNATRAGQLPEELAAQAGYFGKTFVPVLGTSLARNISDLINDPIDKSSMSGAIYSNIPIVGPMIGTKALNALGQPIRADDWGDRLYKLGVPMVFSFPKNSPENTLNELILSKGDGPAIPTRRNVESKMERPLTNEEFYAYVKTYGDSVSKSMFRHRNSLARMDSSRYQSELEDYSKAANERAARTVKRMSMK